MINYKDNHWNPKSAETLKIVEQKLKRYTVFLNILTWIELKEFTSKH